MDAPIYKVAAYIPLSAELAREAQGWQDLYRDVEERAAMAIAEFMANGHIGPIHEPSRVALFAIKEAERKRSQLRRRVRDLVGNRKPGTFQRATR